MSTPAPARDEMPAAFIGHGSPMNALEANRYTAAWRAFGAAVPRPRAILAVSAHWHVPMLAVTAMPRPRTIHDFHGFPPELFAVRYPAPGLPSLVEEVADAVHPDIVGADVDGWGIDHGTWSVLVHMFPDADVPVVQLSIDARRPPDWHLALGARLDVLRRSGVLVLGSGNAVHNLRAIDWQRPDGAFDWTRRMDDAVRDTMTHAPDRAAALMTHADYAQAHPSDEHFLPLLYIAGLAAHGRRGADVLVEGHAYGSLSMACYTVGCAVPAPSPHLPGAAPLDTSVPPQDANV